MTKVQLSEASTATPTTEAQRPHSATPEPITRVLIEQAPLDTGIPAMFRRYGSTVRGIYDQEQTSFAGMQALIAVEFGIEALDLIERRPAAYVPPTEWEDAEGITALGAKNPILKACLYTPMWHGIPEGPTRLSIYSDQGSTEGDVDYAGGLDFLAQYDALRPKLAAMVDALAPQDAAPAVQPQDPDADQLGDVAEHVAMQAVTASLAGLATNPSDVSQRLHRAIDNAQGWHLAKVGDHAEAHAYANSRFHTAVDAMADALGAAGDKARMVRALRNALDMVIDEAGQ